MSKRKIGNIQSALGSCDDSRRPVQEPEKSPQNGLLVDDSGEAENQHFLKQFAKGTGNGGGNKRKVQSCRECPNKLPDGSRNTRRETNWYCAKCMVAFHPGECFNAWHARHHEDFLPLSQKRSTVTDQIEKEGGTTVAGDGGRGNGRGNRTKGVELATLQDDLERGGRSQDNNKSSSSNSSSRDREANTSIDHDRHHLVQFARGTGNGGGNRRKVLSCRECPNKLPDGSRNTRRETNWYCAKCMVAFHPGECFNAWHARHHEDYLPPLRKH